VSASRTSSSLNGFMIAITIFISSPHGDAAAVLESYHFCAVKSERVRVPPDAALQGACHVLMGALTV
jgi:hypothetical protein